MVEKPKKKKDKEWEQKKEKEEQKLSIEKMKKESKSSKRQLKRLKINGELYKTGDYAYFTDKKHIGRIDTINYPNDESQETTLEITW